MQKGRGKITQTMRSFLVLIAIITLFANAMADSPPASAALGIAQPQQHMKLFGQSEIPPNGLTQSNQPQAGVCASLGGLGSCIICTNYLGPGLCGWCGATGECMEGNTAGPYTGNCTKEWAFEPAKCKECVAPKVSGLKGSMAVYNGKYKYAGVLDGFSYFTKGNKTDHIQYLYFDSLPRTWNLSPEFDNFFFVDVQVVQVVADPSRITVNWGVWNATALDYIADPKVKVTCAEKGWNDPCAQFDNCMDCTLNPGLYTKCGWCHSTNKCISAALSAGPLVGKCDIWSSFPFQCPARGYLPFCASQPNCSACITALEPSYCIWCEATKSCMVGSKKGPAIGTCPSWTYNGAVCPGGHSREVMQKCYACLSFDQAVWCASTNSCIPGSFHGGLAEGYSCTDSVYFAIYCPEYKDYCGRYKTCGACTSDSNCGWCQSSKKCLIQGGTGPQNTTCKDWRPRSAHCSVKSKKATAAICATIGGQSCPAKAFNMLSSFMACAKPKCTKEECCSNTCSSFLKCPKYTTKKANNNTACEKYTCAANECCDGKCLLLPKNPCDTNMTFNKTRLCPGRRCLKEDCCQTTCQTFNVTLCGAETKFVANPAEIKCQWSVCKTAECCLPK